MFLTINSEIVRMYSIDAVCIRDQGHFGRYTHITLRSGKEISYRYEKEEYDRIIKEIITYTNDKQTILDIG